MMGLPRLVTVALRGRRRRRCGWTGCGGAALASAAAALLFFRCCRRRLCVNCRLIVPQAVNENGRGDTASVPKES